MSLNLTGLQKKLCNLLQEGLPVCPQPFADLAMFLGSNEKKILLEIEELKKTGVIRRIAAVINYRTLGKVSTLVTSHVPQQDLPEIIAAVSSMQGVSHNYLREHYYNLWFTLQADSPDEIKVILTKLAASFGIEFHSLPVERVFKLDVRFDTEGQGQVDNDIVKIPQYEVVELNENQKLILEKLQSELEITGKPFNFICNPCMDEHDVLENIQQMLDKGVIRRITAAVDHRKLGFVANVLFVCMVDESRIIEAGKVLACFGAVSHCYQRKTFQNWPYNLFAMMHSRTMGDIQHIIDRFTAAEKIDSFELLPTVVELKKQPVKYKLQ